MGSENEDNMMESNTMGHHYMSYDAEVPKVESKGFTLIASLLLLLLLSGMAIGLLMMVNTEGKVGGTDLQNNLAFHAAEGGIEKMASDLSYVFQNAQSPTPAQICAVGLPTTNGPTMVGVTWKDYSVMPGTTQGTSCPASMTTSWGQITGGPDQGLWAQVIPVNMLATAAMPGGQEVSMTRNAEVALIPVFQYGVFCDGDCGFFDSPNLTFAGRVHTNADLYLGVAGGATLTFNNKLEAYGNVVTEVLPNGLSAASYNDTGNVYVPTTTNGCSTTTTNCVLKATNGGSQYGDGSVQGAGGNPPQSTYNGSIWSTFSTSGAPNGTNYMLVNGNYGSASQPGTGAKKLSLPFVSGTSCPGAQLLCPYQIIRRPLATDSTALSQSREYNLAQIHIILSDNPTDPMLKGSGIRLANITATEASATGGTTSNPYGIAITNTPAGTNSYIPTTMGTLSGSTYNLYFAAASNGYLPDITSCSTSGACPTLTTGGSSPTPYNPQYLPADWLFAPQTAPSGDQMLVPTGPPAAPTVVAGSASPYPTFALCPPTSPAPAAASIPAGCPQTPYVSVQNQANASVWNLIDGYLYVEYQDSSGVWHNVTNEWLGLGFARGMTAPTANGLGVPAGQNSNPINPYAILLFQEPADRNGSGGAPDAAGLAAVCSKSLSGVCTQWTNPRPPEVIKDGATGNPYFGVTSTGTPTPSASSTLFTPTGQSVSMLNWYPINFYDAREGEPRDADAGNNSCTTNGLMNSVELDVGNLSLWLQGKSGSSGTSVNYGSQNGYVLYFSDRRGMLPNPNYANALSGDSGLEDVVNSSSSTGVPDGKLEAVPAGHTLSPEDVNENNTLDNFGINNLGLGQWGGGTFSPSTGLVTGSVNQNTQIVAGGNPYSPRMASCSTTARKNWVSGARHVLKLVDGWLGNVPTAPASACQTVSGVTYCGGFTVASENPVYVQGNYNSNSTDTFFTGAASGASGPDVAGHSAASVIADSVTILSNSWNDEISMVGISGNTDVTYTGGPYAGNRVASTTYYRLAVAGGKNMAFPFPSWENSTDYGFGTDGGIHNFLRFLEDWSGQTLNYGGSLVSLYYATYNTGVFKCCAYSVYSPPTRNYLFDADFTNPAGLPPGTPMFRDIESLGYRQMFATRTH